MDERKIYRAAFLERMNLLTIAAAGTAAAFFPGLWCVALPALEAAYLVVMASSDGYRARIQDEVRREAEDEMLRLKKALLRRLSAQGRDRYSHFADLLREIEALSRDGRSVGLEGSSVVFADEELTQLSHLAWIYLKTVSTAERLSHLIFHEERAGIPLHPPDPAGSEDSRIGSRDMAVRIDNLARARDDRCALEGLLEDLENKAMLMRSNQILLGSAEILWRDLDQLAGKLETRTGWLDAAEVVCGIPWDERTANAADPSATCAQENTGAQGSAPRRPALQSSPFSGLVGKIRGEDGRKRASQGISNPSKSLPAQADREAPHQGAEITVSNEDAANAGPGASTEPHQK